MAITGAMKFLRKSYADIDYDGVLVSASSGSTSRNYLRDRRSYTRWTSVGSDDLTTETIVIYFEEAKTVDRIILREHNFKEFAVKYWDGATYQHFSSVVTSEGAQANLSETVNALTSNYYEFASVSTERIQITVLKTMVVDAQKYCHDVVATQELGTFTGYPVHTPKITRAQSRKDTVRGLPKYTVFDDIYSSTLTFNNYPTAADHTLVMGLWEGRQEFLVYPCGGDQGQFRFTDMLCNRLRDIFLVWFDSSFDPAYTQNVYVLGLNYRLDLVEVS
jgi:hypothetical protein